MLLVFLQLCLRCFAPKSILGVSLCWGRRTFWDDDSQNLLCEFFFNEKCYFYCLNVHNHPCINTFFVVCLSGHMPIWKGWQNIFRLGLPPANFASWLYFQHFSMWYFSSNFYVPYSTWNWLNILFIRYIGIIKLKFAFSLQLFTDNIGKTTPKRSAPESPYHHRNVRLCL